jgi:hypothetical protein
MHSKHIAALAAAVLLGLSACAGRARTREPAAKLLSSLQASTTGDSVYFLMQVTNPGPVPLVLEYETDPIFYFTVARTGATLWRSAPDLALATGAARDTIGPADTRSFEASWLPPIGLRGELTVTGVLRERRGAVVETTRFHIP